MKWIYLIHRIILIQTDNSIGVEGARMVSEALKINYTLTELNLKSLFIYSFLFTFNKIRMSCNKYNCKLAWSENCIEDEGAKMISEALKTNSTLTALNLGNNEKKDKFNKQATMK